MNMHKKLTQFGFKKCAFLKLDSNYKTSVSSMVPDNTMRKTEMVGGKWIHTEVKKTHPKWDTFYFLQFSENIKIWILVKSNVINEVYMEDQKGASRIYNDDNIKDKIRIDGRSDIIRLFPKEVQRDFIINSLFD
jgi:hypothetical protein